MNEAVKVSLDFLCVGPQRTASSWLDRALRHHPDLCLPKGVKETFFFDRHYERGMQWYNRFFDHCEEGLLRGEVGSTYFESELVRARVREANPKLRVIVMVRNPIARSYSAFLHEYKKGRAGEDFFEAIQEQPRIVDSGRYLRHGSAWEEELGQGNVLYLSQDEIGFVPQEQFEAVCRFAGVRAVALPEVLCGRYGEGTVPRYQWLARLASRASGWLRLRGLHGVVRMGKEIGLKRVYTGGDPKAFTMTGPIFKYLLAEHEADIQFVEERLGGVFSHWRKPETYGLES